MVRYLSKKCSINIDKEKSGTEKDSIYSETIYIQSKYKEKSRIGAGKVGKNTKIHVNIFGGTSFFLIYLKSFVNRI